MAESYLQKQRRLAREAAARRERLNQQTQAQISKKNALRIKQLAESKERELARSKETFDVASAYGGGSAAKREYEARNAEITSRFSRSGPTKPKPKPKPKAEVKPKPKPKPAPADVKPSKPPVSAAEQKTTTTRPPAQPARTETKSKADSKPAAKSSETYREGGKGLYQGTQEYREKIGGSGNPLLNRFRRDMGRDMTTGGAPSQKTEKETPTSKQGSSASSTFEQNKLKIEQDKTAKPFDVRGVFPKKKKKQA